MTVEVETSKQKQLAEIRPVKRVTPSANSFFSPFLSCAPSLTKTPEWSFDLLDPSEINLFV